MITQSELKQKLFYDPVSGYFARYLPYVGFWRVVGAKEVSYLQVFSGEKMELAHRLAWLYVYGEWPENQIDHIDHDPSNNQIDNLREVTAQDNQRNRKMNNNNTSGHTGVYLNKSTGKWYSQIMVDGKNKALGIFDEIKDAIASRKLAEIEHGFHENHGRTL